MKTLIVGGAVKIKIDAIRYLSVNATGDTAIKIQKEIPKSYLLLGENTKYKEGEKTSLFSDRKSLEQSLQNWITKNPDSTIILSAAINDYDLKSTAIKNDNIEKILEENEKAPSQNDEIIIRLKPSDKVIDKLKKWGHKGKLIAFKYEDKSTVANSAKELLERTNAHCVIANSLCGEIQKIILKNKIITAKNREDLLDKLIEIL